MIGSVIVALLASLAVVYVGRAIGRERPVGGSDSPIESARQQKQAALATILDLEDDLAIGRLNQSDYDALLVDAEAEAVEATRSLDVLERIHDDALEAEVANLRTKLECPNCGASRAGKDRCPRCGA